MSSATGPDAARALDDLGEAELVEERGFLLRSLADLDAELTAGDIDEHDYVALKDGYTARAAAVLRALDQRRGLPGPAGPDQTAPTSAARPANAHMTKVAPVRRRTDATGARRRVRTIATVLLVALFAGAAGLLVAQRSGQRVAGGSLTGAVTPAGPQSQLAQARTDLNNGKYLDAIKSYEAVLQQDPRNPEALAYRGWILALTGRQANDASLIDRGLLSERAAEASDPSYPDAHFFAGMILLSAKSDPQGAVTEFRLFLSNNPPAAMVPEVQGQLDAALAMIPASPTTTLGSPTTTRPTGP